MTLDEMQAKLPDGVELVIRVSSFGVEAVEFTDGDDADPLHFGRVTMTAARPASKGLAMALREAERYLPVAGRN